MMTMEQCEIRNEVIIENAIEWANSRECNILEQIDIVVLGEYLNIKIPQCFYNFVNSSSVNSVKCYGAEKTIFKTLDKIRKGLLEINK